MMLIFTYEKDVLIWKVFQVIGVLVEIAGSCLLGYPVCIEHIHLNLFV